ncbi:MAG: hypothetical protein IPJ89_03200 [Candidatus Iainarchaeum archaeon]|uniref:Uncharacterized protein n=1 Tax=Candidatus Iainarchaeum sp. TaxID=3101447 RepID=A0A7T9DIT0_9ARCH|nr:MAG: hypothetical protein IPJ89_03200 [Candidatus Diapherotrites archaeon]
MFVNGNATTALMHLLTWNELHRLRVNAEWPITKMKAEQKVLVNFARQQNPKEGAFDFYVETPRKRIGFEVLTRPSKGKMLRKISYRDEVDEFVFVIPHDSLLPYQKTETAPGFHVRSKALPKEFAQKGLYIWLVDLAEQRIIKRAPIARIYHVESAPMKRK